MKFSFMLAPLEDVSDNAFRELCFQHGADLTFTEMARLSGIVRNNKSTMKKIQIFNNVPTQIQFATNNENDLNKFLNSFEPTPGFSGINFNLGCPSPHLINQGLGCVLIKRISKIARLVKMVKEKGYSCSIKMRLGLNLFEKQKKVYLNLIKGVDADFFIIHPRHGTEHYEAPADYSIYPECVDTGKNIVANGDIDSLEKFNVLKNIGVKGVMIGRAAVRNPAIFEMLKGINKTDTKNLKEEYLVLAKKYFQGNTKYADNVLEYLGKINTRQGEEHVRG
jgi:tRNA-dihydrouridine synthase B